ncbi:MFS transporter [bacterium]|nr:MFS transporter [bacterium]
MPPSHSKSLSIIFVTTLIDMIGFGIVIPILPYFAEHFGANGFEIGLLTSVYLLMQFIFTPIWGYCSDRWGRRPVILICIFASSMAYVIFGLAQSLVLILAARIVGGVFAGKFATIQAYIADVTTKENRSKGMGLFGAAFGLGFILGPSIGGILGKWGYQTPLFFAAALTTINGLAAIFLLPESLPDDARAQAQFNREENKFNMDTLRRYAGVPAIRSGMTLSMIYNFGFSILYATFALFAEREFGFHTMETGYMFAFMGIVGAVIQGGLIGKISRAIGEEKMIVFGLLITSFGMFAMSRSEWLWLLIVASFLVSVGSALLTPALSGLVSKKSSETEQGRILGIIQSLSNLARMTGIAFGGFVFEAVGIWSPFWMSGIILIAGCGMAYYMLLTTAEIQEV